MTIMLQTTPPDLAALAQRPDPAGPLAVATPTTRKLADASISRNTRRAYLGALARLDAWRGTAPLNDARLAAYLGALFEAGRAPATAALAVAAVRFRAKLVGQADPAGPATARVLGGFRRSALTCICGSPTRRSRSSARSVSRGRSSTSSSARTRRRRAISSPSATFAQTVSVS